MIRRPPRSTLFSLHDALPISNETGSVQVCWNPDFTATESESRRHYGHQGPRYSVEIQRSEEHTSELQSLAYLVCRLLLEKKKKTTKEIDVLRTNNNSQ